MKRKRKVLSAAMAFLIVIGTILSPPGTRVEAETYAEEEIREDSVDIVYEEMRDGRSERADFPFMYVKNHCMTNDIQIIASKGYTNVVAYQMPEDGQIKVEALKVWLLNTSGERTVEFAVIDGSGKVLSNGGEIAVIDTEDSTKSGMKVDALELKKGEMLYFVFHGTEGATNPIRCSARIMTCTDGAVWVQADQKIYNGEPLVWAANTDLDAAVQGKENFYYGYSDTYATHTYTRPAPQDPLQPTIPGTAVIPEANEEGYMPTYKISFEVADMVASTVHASFPWSMPDKEYDCMTNPTGNKVVSPGYANITTYQVQESGTITLKNMTASTHVATTPDNAVLFAVTDKEGNILYPSDGTLAVLDKDKPKFTGTFLKDHKVEKGDELNFIFEGVVGKTASCWISGIIVHTDSQGNETRLTREDGLIAPISGSTDQGADGFYYRYAKTFENVQTGYAVPPAPEVLPGNPVVPTANAQGLVPQYKISFEAADMVASTVHKAFPWSMPGKEYDCMTNPVGNQIVSKGYANIITYKAQTSGKLTLKNMTVAINVTDAPENVVLFAVTDQEGNVLYPSDGTLVVLDKENEAVTGTFLSKYEIKKGEELNFIFQGVKGKTVSCRLRGILVSIDAEGNETRLTREAGGYIAPISGNTDQGADGFYYRYAKQFENIMIGYVEPKSTAVQWGEGISVVVSNNPNDLVYLETASEQQAEDETVDMIRIIKPEVQLRYQRMPWIIAAVSGVLFCMQCIVFALRRRKGARQNEENT